MIASLGIVLVVACSAATVEPAGDANFTSLRILHYADPRFLAGLEKEGLLADYGYRFLNSGFVTTPFRERWLKSQALADARATGRPYYIDRITGGMPFQPLDGIEEISAELKADANFLGFQVHEWDNSPLCDYGRIHEHFLSKGLPLDAAQFARFEGRTSMPYFSGGNYAVYRELYRPLQSQSDVESYLQAYFKRLVALTQGQIVSVNGHRQFAHTALRLGAKNVMAEIGNQVPMTALQIACVRGAARQYGKPFGAYYETWGGAPFGCACATDFSPWFATHEQFAAFHEMGSVGPQFGSGRSLHRRLLYFAWLAGAQYWAEEWGAENYFADWQTYPLTEYGQLTKDFVAAAAKQGGVAPIVPGALVLPPGAFGVDVLCVSGQGAKLYGMVAPDPLHQRLKEFASRVLSSPRGVKGYDVHNLTSSPWINCFDVLSHEAPPDLLAKYTVLIFFDAQQAQAASAGGAKVHVFTGADDDLGESLNAIQQVLPYRVQGEVGSAQARKQNGYLVGVFNNLGTAKTPEGETKDPAATKSVIVEGACSGLTPVCGAEHIREASERAVTLDLPAGAVAVLAFDRAEAKR